jgi:hypothetical protein
MVLVPDEWMGWYWYLVDGMVLVPDGWMVWYWYLMGGWDGTGI